MERSLHFTEHRGQIQRTARKLVGGGQQPLAVAGRQSIEQGTDLVPCRQCRAWR